MPSGYTSKREAKVGINSIAQQASPKVTGQTEDLRAQLRNASTTVVTTKPPGKLKSPSVTLSKRAECLSPSGRSWRYLSHSCRSLDSVQTAGGTCRFGAFMSTRRSPPASVETSKYTPRVAPQPAGRDLPS